MTGNELADVRHVAPADLTPSEAQARARAAWRQSGGTLTGAELGERFDRSERWGRQQIAAARAEDTAATTATTAAAATPAAVERVAESVTAPDGAAPAPAAHARHAGGGTAAASTSAPSARPAGNGSRRDAVPASGMPPGRAAGTPAAAGMRPGTAPERAAASRLLSGTPVAERPAHDRQDGTVPFPLIATTVAAVVLVTVVCAVVSYGHIRDLALIAGMGSQAAWLPLGVDGLVVASSCAVIVDHQLGRRGQPLAWCGVALGLAGSLAANVLAVDPELVSLRAVRWVLAGYTPAALAVSGHLLFRMLGERQ